MLTIEIPFSGDSAEADSVDAALLAAFTLIEDLPVASRNTARQSAQICKGGRYSIMLTALARHGHRSLRDFEIAELRALPDPFA